MSHSKVWQKEKKHLKEVISFHGLLWWLSGKEVAYNAGDASDEGSIPRSATSSR